jgi:hypothetical protein
MDRRPRVCGISAMAILSRIYFNAVFGALGGLLGWLLFGVFGNRAASTEHAMLFLTWEHLNWLLGGVLIGGVIGFFVVSVDAIRDQAPIRFARLASYGMMLGAVGGMLGMLVGEGVNLLLQKGAFLLQMLGRGLGWMLLGVAIGMSEGIAARSMGKFSYGALGGAIGGFLGGMLFHVFYHFNRQFASTTYLWSALGLVILGACIGSLSALVQTIFQPASVRVLRGWQEGREYALDKSQNLLGREEHADIALFRDMRVEKRHAYIRQQNGRYVLVNHGAPPQYTLVNDMPVTGALELADGDRIQLGNVLLRFQLRAAAIRPKPRKRPTG